LKYSFTSVERSGPVIIGLSLKGTGPKTGLGDQIWGCFCNDKLGSIHMTVSKDTYVKSEFMVHHWDRY